MFPDFKELLSAFNAHQVRYLVVGGYAVSFHAQPRATRDLDILIAADPENGRAVYRALAAFGAPLEGLNARDLIEPGSFFRMGTPPVMVDILPRISGVDFELAWQRRVDVAIDDALNAPFISHEDLVAAKLAAGRPQDLADVAALSAQKELAATRGPEAGSLSAKDDEIVEAQRKAREAWLEQKQLQGATPTSEDLKAKSREEWLKLREQQAQQSAATDEGDRTGDRNRDLERRPGAGLGVDEGDD